MIQYKKIKMSEKSKNKYTIKSARLSNYDYSQSGMYFVTICTKDKEYFFGDVKAGKMMLNDVGKIIQDEWSKTPIIRNNVILDEWVIMPNHLHGIIEIRNNENNNFIVETPRRGVSTTTITMLDNKPKRGGYNPNWKPNSLGSIINQFKSVCTKRVWKS